MTPLLRDLIAVAEAAMDRHPAGDLPVVFATGDNFPDGLAAGGLAAHLAGILLLVPQGQLPDSVSTFLADTPSHSTPVSSSAASSRYPRPFGMLRRPPCALDR